MARELALAGLAWQNFRKREVVMKKTLFVLAVFALISACSGSSVVGDDANGVGEYPKDPNTTKANCLRAGEENHIPPADTPTDKCCSGLKPATFFTPQSASTGYRHYLCVHADKCTPDGAEVEHDKFVPCCDGLIIMQGKCVSLSACSGDEGRILVAAPLDQKECVASPDCVRSGEIDRSVCQYCCVGSKYTIRMMTGRPPEKCLAPDESISADESGFGWSEPEVVTQEEYDAFKAKCASEHRP